MGGNFSRDTGQSEALQSAAAMVIRCRHRHGPRNVKTSAAMSRIRANHATTTRDVRTVDASARGRRSTRNLEIGGLTPTARARKFADAD